MTITSPTHVSHLPLSPTLPDLSKRLAALLAPPSGPLTFRAWLEAARAAIGPHCIVGRADVIHGCPLSSWIADALHLADLSVEVDTDERRSRVLVTLFTLDDEREERRPLTIPQRAPAWILAFVNVIDAKAQNAVVVVDEALAALDIATAEGEREGSAR